ncbi:MAG: NHL repeat-containing protein [Planctomycetota bacterium]|nr:MAG: NHL repeat-containing protein [Planctomycetota bacterium]
MIANCIRPIACLLILAGQLLAITPIPSSKRIEAHVDAILVAPDDRPMHMPTDVAVDGTGRIYVADGANDRIVCFDRNGKFETALSGWDDDQLNQPVGLTVDSQNNLWIADTGSHRLLVVDSEGKLINRIVLPEAEGGHPFDPTDLAVTADGKRTYIVDNDNHRIVIRDNESGRLIPKGQFGRSVGRFQWPFMISIGPDGYIYISETIGAWIQRMAPSDRWAGLIGRWGVELGRFYRPKGIAVDKQSWLYVSDSTLGVVQVFDSQGRVKGVLTDKQGNLLRFEHPMGMWIDAQGKLYVVELKRNRVAVVTLQANPQLQTNHSARRTGTGGQQ